MYRVYTYTRLRPLIANYLGARQHAIDIGCTHHRVMQHCAENTVKETPCSGSKGGRLRSPCTCLVPTSESSGSGLPHPITRSPIDAACIRGTRPIDSAQIPRGLFVLHSCTHVPTRVCCRVYRRAAPRMRRHRVYAAAAARDSTSYMARQHAVVQRRSKPSCIIVACNAAKAKVQRDTCSCPAGVTILHSFLSMHESGSL